MKTNSLNWRPTNLWVLKLLASVGMSVGFVLQLRVMLVAVVALVDISRGPIKLELVLVSAATQPVKPHVHIFVLTRHNCVVSDARGSGFFILKGRIWLRTTYFDGCLS